MIRFYYCQLCILKIQGGYNIPPALKNLKLLIHFVCPFGFSRIVQDQLKGISKLSREDVNIRRIFSISGLHLME